jgi:hypothetical protein
VSKYGAVQEFSGGQTLYFLCPARTGNRGNRFSNFFGLQYLVPGTGTYLKAEQSIGKGILRIKVEGVFLYFHAFLCGNEFMWP